MAPFLTFIFVVLSGFLVALFLLVWFLFVCLLLLLLLGCTCVARAVT